MAKTIPLRTTPVLTRAHTPETRKGIRKLDFAVKKGAGVTITGRITVSDGDKTRMVTSKGTDAHGKKFKSIAVYEQ